MTWSSRGCLTIWASRFPSVACPKQRNPRTAATQPLSNYELPKPPATTEWTARDARRVRRFTLAAGRQFLRLLAHRKRGRRGGARLYPSAAKGKAAAGAA